MISRIYPIQFNNKCNYNQKQPAFTGRHWNKVGNIYYDSLEFSECIKYVKRIFNYAPRNSEKIHVYKGPLNPESGLSTENLKDVGGGYLKAACHTPLSTTGVRTCAVLNAIDEHSGTNILYHVHDETSVNKIEQFLRKFMPDFNKVNIVGGDQFKTANTMKKIVNAVENVNPYAQKTFYYTVSDNPEIVAYNGHIYYIEGKSGTASFTQNMDYWY